MIQSSEKFIVTTPCFCAGAEPSHAEIRVPTIRGQLRWWFRLLKGTREQEQDIFGSVHGTVSASKLVVRVADVQPVYGEAQSLPSPNRELYYLFHFARVSSEKVRYRKGAWFAAGTRFQVDWFFRRQPSAEALALFQQAWRLFRLFGSLGLRQTRGLGAFTPDPKPSQADVMDCVKALRAKAIPVWGVCETPGQLKESANWFDALSLLEAALGYVRKKTYGGRQASPMGSSSPRQASALPRQASALHLRPVQLDSGRFLSLLFLTPEVLGKDSCSKGQVEVVRKVLDERCAPFPWPYMQKAPQPDIRKAFYFLPLNP